MAETGIIVVLDGGRREFQPGERLAGRYEIYGVASSDLKEVEVCVHWFTDGKGDKDLGIHFQEKRGADDPGPLTEGTFAAMLPPSPLSYDGVLFKIVWCVRVRATRGGWSRALEGAAYFLLGDTAQAYGA
jgi:hypothetical protein